MAKLSRASIAALKQELVKKEAQVRRLKAQREKLAAELEAVDRELAELTGSKARTRAAAAASGAGRTGKKPGRRPRLAEAIVRILSDSSDPLNAAQIAAALKRRRVKTRSSNLTNLVREALSRIPQVRRVSRGKYTAKG